MPRHPIGAVHIEDYNADFLTMLETWEAAVDFYRNQSRQPIEIARVLRR